LATVSNLLTIKSILSSRILGVKLGVNKVVSQKLALHKDLVNLESVESIMKDFKVLLLENESNLE
jgi:hypothetical protein